MEALQHTINRKIHLDFHTPHWVQQVGQHFDPEALVAVWQKARVNAVTAVFGYCACGNAYYDSPAGQVHPGLEQDLLGLLLPAAKRAEIAIYVHFSIGIHDRAVLEHPEWAMKRKDGSLYDTREGQEWGWPCLNSPFVEEWFWPQLRDFVPRYPDVVGIFLDMVMFPTDTCYCTYCREKAAAAGLDINRTEHMQRFEQLTLERFMAETRRIIRELNPDMEFTCNNQWFIGGARSESLDFVELEAPVSWNSYHYPVMARYIRTLPVPSGGMTTRFPHNWGYFGSLNNETQLKFECATILSTLGSCCIGDQLHPSGRPDEGVYELIGEAYRFVEEREEWALNARSVPYIAVLADLQRNAEVRAAGPDYYDHQTTDSLYGSGLALLEDSRHFDVIDELSDIAPYKLLWLAENRTLDAKLAPQIEAFVREGGKLLVTGSGLWSRPEWRPYLERWANVEMEGFKAEGGAYFRPMQKFFRNVPEVPFIFKDRVPLWKMGDNAQMAARLVQSYEEVDLNRRFGHFHAPAGEDTEYPAVVMNEYGKGKIAVFAAPLGQEYFRIGSRHLRLMVTNALDWLIVPSERLVEVDAASPSVEISLMEQRAPGGGRCWVLHLVQYGAKRHTGHTVIEELPVRRDIPVRIRVPQKPARVYLAPERRPVEWHLEEGVLHAIIPELHIHQMLVAEWEGNEGCGGSN